ncbi:MAG: OmpH family outer membrane protein [Flavobacteriales bacterium]|nr:OmpH family outer membrane protein [Flavobacteriales bacterium]
MNKVTLTLSVAALLLSTSLYFFGFTSGDKIAYVENTRLVLEYKAMKEARAAFEQKAKLWQDNVDTLGAEMQRKLQEYEKKRASLSESELKLMEELLNTKDQQYRQYTEAMQQKYREEEQKYQGEVIQQMNTLIKDWGKEHHYRIIMGATNMGNVVYADEAINVTDEVLKMLNGEE